MKKIFYISLLTISFGCNKKGCLDENAQNFSPHSTKDDGSCLYSQPEELTKVTIPFEGEWQRQFEAGTGTSAWHTVLYSVYQDSIRYTLTGPVGNANYVMYRDTFILSENRFIGRTSDNVHYLIFAKGITSDSIKIYKEIIPSFEEGMLIEIPHDTTTANHGWSYYSH